LCFECNAASHGSNWVLRVPRKGAERKEPASKGGGKKNSIEPLGSGIRKNRNSPGRFEEIITKDKKNVDSESRKGKGVGRRKAIWRENFLKGEEKNESQHHMNMGLHSKKREGKNKKCPHHKRGGGTCRRGLDRGNASLDHQE